MRFSISVKRDQLFYCTILTKFYNLFYAHIKSKLFLKKVFKNSFIILYTIKIFGQN